MKRNRLSDADRSGRSHWAAASVSQTCRTSQCFVSLSVSLSHCSIEGFHKSASRDPLSSKLSLAVGYFTLRMAAIY